MILHPYLYLNKGGHTKWVQSFAALENGNFASGSEDHAIKIWNSKSCKLLWTFNETNGGHNGSVYTMAYLENGYLASGANSEYDFTVKIWDLL